VCTQGASNEISARHLVEMSVNKMSLVVIDESGGRDENYKTLNYFMRRGASHRRTGSVIPCGKAVIGWVT